MINHPSAAEIVRAVAHWVDEIRPQLDARNAYLARVAANGLAIVGRELEHAKAAEQEIAPHLAKVLGQDGDYEVLLDELCKQLRSGAMNATTPGLLSALRVDTLAKLEVDQPAYRHATSRTNST